MNKFAAGDINQSIEINKNDEIGELDCDPGRAQVQTQDLWHAPPEQRLE